MPAFNFFEILIESCSVGTDSLLVWISFCFVLNKYLFNRYKVPKLNKRIKEVEIKNR